MKGKFLQCFHKLKKENGLWSKAVRFPGRGEAPSPHKHRRLVAHGPDFFFHYRNVHHDYRVPGASVEEGALWTFTEALLASDALQGVYLDAAEGWMIVIRYPKHAIFHRAILDAGGRSGAAGAALGDDGKFFRLFLAGGEYAFRARLLFQLVRH